MTAIASSNLVALLAIILFDASGDGNYPNARRDIGVRHPMLR